MQEEVKKMNKRLATIAAILVLGSMLLLLVPQANSSTIADIYLNPSTTVSGKLGKLFNVTVNTRDVTNLYAYEFKLDYNTTLLQVTKVYNGSFFPLPPKSIIAKLQINNTAGTVWFAASLLAPEAPKSGSGVLATITFNTTYSAPYPETAGCTLHLYNVKFSDSNANPITVNIIDGEYKFIALHGDINGDGRVDILDIVIVTSAFGCTPSDPSWNPKADLKTDGIIDIFDVVLVANNYGATG